MEINNIENSLGIDIFPETRRGSVVPDDVTTISNELLDIVNTSNSEEIDTIDDSKEIVNIVNMTEHHHDDGDFHYSDDVNLEKGTVCLSKVNPTLSTYRYYGVHRDNSDVFLVADQLDIRRLEICLNTYNHRYTLAAFPDVKFLSASTVKTFLFAPFAAHSIARAVVKKSLQLTVFKMRRLLDKIDKPSGNIRPISPPTVVKSKHAKVYEKITRKHLIKVMETIKYSGNAATNSYQDALLEDELERMQLNMITDIKALWDNGGREASSMGTRLHEIIEFFFNIGHFPTYVPKCLLCELVAVTKFMDYYINDPALTGCTDYNEYRYAPVTFELAIYDKQYPICGTIDALLARLSKNGNILKDTQSGKPVLTLCDWKHVSVELIEKYRSSTKYGKQPLDYMRDSSLSHYTLQQNIYRYILEKNYNVVIEEMWLIEFIKGTETFKRIIVPTIANDVLEDCFNKAVIGAEHRSIAVTDISEYKSLFSSSLSTDTTTTTTTTTTVTTSKQAVQTLQEEPPSLPL
ncbi:Helicase protein [Dolichomitus sp. PSUC_FEM 10030005]|nr:Helicase protein [Dolichomitus sp. PSUC_FEM 10030005]